MATTLSPTSTAIVNYNSDINCFFSSNMPPTRVKSVVTRAEYKRKAQDKTVATSPKWGRRSQKSKTNLQGRPDLQITVPSNTNTASLTINIPPTTPQTVSTAAMQPSSLQPDSAGNCGLVTNTGTSHHTIYKLATTIATTPVGEAATTKHNPSLAWYLESSNQHLCNTTNRAHSSAVDNHIVDNWPSTV